MNVLTGTLACALAFLLVGDASGQCTVTTVSGTAAPDSFCAGDLIFSDDFDKLDLKKWQHENTLAGGGNWEFQWYTNNRSNSYVRDGVLHLKPTLTADILGEPALSSGTLDLEGGAPADYCTNAAFYGCLRAGTPSNIINPIRSARLRTVNSFSFKYGRVVTRAKMPSGDWLWPAIWMMPRDNAFGGWPTSGEIDIVESRGNPSLIQNGNDIGNHMVGSTLHWGPDYSHNRFEQTHWEQKNAAGYNAEFHEYEVIWNPDGLTFKVDGVEIGAVKPPAGGFWELGNLAGSGLSNPWVNEDKMAPFNNEFYIIMNLAVGGVNYFPDDAVNPTPKPWNNNSPTTATDFWNGRSGWLPTWALDQNDNAALQVDYVRVYAV